MRSDRTVEQSQETFYCNKYFYCKHFTDYTYILLLKEHFHCRTKYFYSVILVLSLKSEYFLRHYFYNLNSDDKVVRWTRWADCDIMFELIESCGAERVKMLKYSYYTQHQSEAVCLCHNPDCVSSRARECARDSLVYRSSELQLSVLGMLGMQRCSGRADPAEETWTSFVHESRRCFTEETMKRFKVK